MIKPKSTQIFQQILKIDIGALIRDLGTHLKVFKVHHTGTLTGEQFSFTLKVSVKH